MSSLIPTSDTGMKIKQGVVSLYLSQHFLKNTSISFRVISYPKLPIFLLFVFFKNPLDFSRPLLTYTHQYFYNFFAVRQKLLRQSQFATSSYQFHFLSIEKNFFWKYINISSNCFIYSFCSKINLIFLRLEPYSIYRLFLWYSHHINCLFYITLKY